MGRLNIEYSCVEKQLRDALKLYFCSKWGYSEDDFEKWFKSINAATENWKLMDKERTESINRDYGVPEWFMSAMHATI